MMIRPSIEQVRNLIATSPSVAGIINFTSNYPDLTSTHLVEIFKYLLPRDENGVSDWIEREFLKTISLKFDNQTMGWRHTLKDMGYNIEVIKDGVKVVKYRFNGMTNKVDWKQRIRPDIWREIIKHRCVSCGTSTKIECDHKDGRKNDPLVGNTKTQLFSHFQPMCEHCNKVKKCACEKCIATGKRFDARTMGYKVGWIVGNENYDPTIGCVGCRMYDPLVFVNAQFSIINNTIKTERYNMNIPDSTINRLLESIPLTQEMNELAIQLTSGNDDIGHKIMLCQKITEIFTKMNSFKEMIQDFKTLNLSDEDSKFHQELSDKNENGSQSITMKDLALKVNFVYNYDGVYFKVNDPTGGNGSITVLGYDSENPFVKESESKDANWAAKLSSCTRITEIKKVRYNMKTDYPPLGKGEKTRLKGVGCVSNYTKPKSFKEIGSAQVDSTTPPVQQNVVQANTSTLSGDGVCASDAA